MGSGWRATIEAGLGDARTRLLGSFLIVVAVVGTYIMHTFANFETGSVLGRWWTVLVPVTSLVVLQSLEWSAGYSGYPIVSMAGISFFVISGFVFVAFIGRRIRPRVLLRVKSVALLTTISVPLTITYDLWTAFGEWYFLTRPFGVGLATVLYLQVPFTLYHLLSSLIFVPLFGSMFLFLRAYGWPAKAEDSVPSPGERE